MKGHESKDKNISSKASAITRAQLEDDSIMGTNNSSIVSKRSVEQLYFPDEPHFFRYFVKKPQRRSPLINRGYWLRMKAIDSKVARFLSEKSTKRKVVINLGCGYDPLPWQCLSRYPDACENAIFVDVDYKELMLKKRQTVENIEELNSIFTKLEIFNDGDILLKSDRYFQVGCDLRNIDNFKSTLAGIITHDDLILFVAEVSITYMPVESANTLIKWAGSLVNSQFCLLEQILPDGPAHPFARTMMAHFNKLKTPLRPALMYPTTEAQEHRFTELGWQTASACNLWNLWSQPGFITPSERAVLDSIEPFDEWEEFALFGQHYVLLEASSVSRHTSGEISVSSRVSSRPEMPSMDCKFTYSEVSKSQGYRRFAAAIPLRSSNPASDLVGNFAGMGVVTRTSSCDIFINKAPKIDASTSNKTLPPSRMCHTITSVGNIGSLLVGGRASPDSALADCWLHHKWLDTWERINDLPQGRYRHSAVSLGLGCVLISTGRLNSTSIAEDYLIWSRQLGWIKCNLAVGEDPVVAYGATMILPEDQVVLAQSAARRGLLVGGLNKDGTIRQGCWQWELENICTQTPTLKFRRTSQYSLSERLITRFGATSVNFQGRTFIVGGVIEKDVLTRDEEICSLSVSDSSAAFHRIPEYVEPRPLLIGTSAMSTGDSLLIMGGSAVCFSFGNFWNRGCYTVTVPALQTVSAIKPGLEVPEWRYSETSGCETRSAKLPDNSLSTGLDPQPIISVLRLKIETSVDFDRVLENGKPVILEGLDLGACTTLWSTDYLKSKIGQDREVIVHKSNSQHMDFTAKNFEYTKMRFGDFIEEVEGHGKLYLRSLSLDKPAQQPANLTQDFPSISNDFTLPHQLKRVLERMHSSPLRISGPVIMWLHYDVMANVLCQIRGTKRLLLYPPSDVGQFGLEPGASSSGFNPFDELNEEALSRGHPHEAILKAGDVLFLPSLWLHTASPSSEISIAVNVFFRNLEAGYSAGKDVYGNRDLQAYEKGRQDVARIVKSFRALPSEVRGFYLQRLARELEGL